MMHKSNLDRLVIVLFALEMALDGVGHERFFLAGMQAVVAVLYIFLFFANREDPVKAAYNTGWSDSERHYGYR